MKWAAIALLLAGCMTISPDRAAKLDDKSLCNHYGNAQDKSYLKQDIPNIRAEIDRRNLVSPDEWSLIEAKQVKIGMSVCALRAAWGSAKENSTRGRYGNHIQHVYRLSWCRRCNVQYVYTENGRVTAIQD